MRITLSLGGKVLKAVRKIAVQRGTTVTGLVREYLEKLAAENAISRASRGDHEALERSFKELQFRIGKHTWKRADLYERD